MLKHITLLGLAALFVSTGVTAFAQQKKVVVVDPAQTGPDYAAQGEYVGKLNSSGPL